MSVANGGDEILEKQKLLERWDSAPLAERDTLLQEAKRLNLYPDLMRRQDELEEMAGLYPDTEDPRFTEKLMRKLEFAESRQESILAQQEAQEEGAAPNPCDQDKEFELTPVQRFIGRFLSPQCPYTSALLYHGVGVGKTCAAVTVAENYLRSYPRRSVFIVAPRNIQPGFRTTIFDASEENLVIPEEDDVPNTCRRSCTGNTYLTRTGSEYEKDRGVIARRVAQSVNTRYTILGYIQFHRYIEQIIEKAPKGATEEATKALQQRALRREFSGRLVIIDECHNLRDAPGESAEDDKDVAGGETELGEAQAGKKLTPSLNKVLDAAEGMKLVLMSGTPMYNSYKEIIFLLNLLLKNDKKVTLSERDIFAPQGGFKPGGEELLGAAANAYVSFMRGENPLSFPVRLKVRLEKAMDAWPTRSPVIDEIPPEEGQRLLRLPFVPVQFTGAELDAYKRINEEAIEAGGISVNAIDEMVQSGNWLFPTDAGPQIREAGFDACFRDVNPPKRKAALGGGDKPLSGGGKEPPVQTGGAGSEFQVVGDGRWLLAEGAEAGAAAPIQKASPKAAYILKQVQKTKGIAFVYSRFIKSGVLPLALALEANGYTAWGRERQLLQGGPKDDRGRQCALCPKRERFHAGSSHKFVPAQYIMLTGQAHLSPNNPSAIKAVRARSNMDGRQIKVILGSAVASEGVDFRFVREIYMMDSWFHLNKMEQVLGRGIRTCSHALLPPEQRNCTIHLMVNVFDPEESTETADLYMYRQAMTKAIQVGRVSRVLKRYALDCNLNREAIIVTGLSSQRHVDGQGQVHEEVNINDTPFTYMCDWLETCEYTCAKPVNFEELEMDTSTYDTYAARWRDVELKKAIRRLFSTDRMGPRGMRGQPMFHLEDLKEIFSEIPEHALAGLLSEIVGNKSFRVRSGGKEGYIVYRNGYYLFQPDYLSDMAIPLAIRVADVPVRRDTFEPATIKLAPKSAPAAVGAVAPAASGPAEAAPAEPESASAVVPARPAELGGNLKDYWMAIKEWALMIRAGEAETARVPRAVITAVEARYASGEQVRELEYMNMFNWIYETIHTKTESPERRKLYETALSQVLLDCVWDISLRPTEQHALLDDELAVQAAREQIVEISGRRAYRYVDPSSGTLKYICADGPCSPAVAQVFEANPADPYNRVKADTSTTARLYGFISAKFKDARLLFKTGKNPPPPGGKVEQGSECANISNISFHINMLKEIGELSEGEGYSRLFLTDEVLNDVAKWKKGYQKVGLQARNSVRACALKEIVLRWMDLLETQKGAGAAGGAAARGRRYFFRPVSAVKTGHKGK